MKVTIRRWNHDTLSHDTQEIECDDIIVTDFLISHPGSSPRQENISDNDIQVKTSKLPLRCIAVLPCGASDSVVLRAEGGDST